jgi:hypothetical protein
MASHTRFTPTDPPTPGQAPVLKVKTHVKAGVGPLNHNKTLVQAPRPTAGLRVKTHLKAGLVRGLPGHDG